MLLSAEEQSYADPKGGFRLYTCVTALCLTLSPRGDLLLDGQHQFGFSSQVLAAPLLVLQRNGDAARQVVHAADDGRVCVCLRWPTNGTGGRLKERYPANKCKLWVIEILDKHKAKVILLRLTRTVTLINA